MLKSPFQGCSIKCIYVTMYYNFRYVDMVGITNPSDNINFVMRQLANDLNATISGNVSSCKFI